MSSNISVKYILFISTFLCATQAAAQNQDTLLLPQTNDSLKPSRWGFGIGLRQGINFLSLKEVSDNWGLVEDADWDKKVVGNSAFAANFKFYIKLKQGLTLNFGVMPEWKKKWKQYEGPQQYIPADTLYYTRATQRFNEFSLRIPFEVSYRVAVGTMHVSPSFGVTIPLISDGQRYYESYRNNDLSGTGWSPEVTPTDKPQRGWGGSTFYSTELEFGLGVDYPIRDRLFLRMAPKVILPLEQFYTSKHVIVALDFQLIHF